MSILTPTITYKSKLEVEALLKQPLTQRKRVFLQARQVYYNSKDGSTIMSDKTFDRLEDSIKAEDPDWKHLKKTGAPVAGKKFKRALASYLPSLSKFYPEHEAKLLKWASDARRWVVSAKMDGSSIQGTYDFDQKGKLVALSTRGNGVIGKSIDHFIPALVAAKALPASIPGLRKGKVFYRMEAVVPYKTWSLYYREEFASARAMASALFNRNDVHPALTKGHVRLIVVQVQAEREHNQAPLSQMLDAAAEQGFGVVKYDVLYASTTAKAKAQPHPLSVQALLETLKRFKFTSSYELDGLVIQKDDAYYPYTPDHPDFAYAFKENDEDSQVETTIEDIEWEVSRTNRVVPRAKLKPVMFDGVKVTYATLNNLEWCKSQGIGVGAQVILCRSGEVIPKILSVTKKAKLVLPTAKSLGVSRLYTKGRDLMADRNEDDAKHRAQRHLFALQTVGIEHLAQAAAEKLAVWFTRPLNLIAALYSSRGLQYLGDAGISVKIAEKTLAKLPKSIPLAMLMKASGVFYQGLGERRFQALVDAGLLRKRFLTEPTSLYRTKVIDTIGVVMGERFLLSLTQFWMEFEAVEHILGKAVDMRTSDQIGQARGAELAKTGKVSSKLKGQAVTFTGYRDAAQEEAVMRAGGTIVSFGLKTTVLIYKEGGKASSKIETARKKGIRVCTFQELKL